MYINCKTKIMNTNFDKLHKLQKKLLESTTPEQLKAIRALHAICTCKDCGSKRDCEYAWDEYNTHGDCLAEK